MQDTTRKTAYRALCLSPLIPALLVPGVGVLGSMTIMLLALIFVRQSRQGTLAFIFQNVSRSVAIGISAGVVIQAALYFGVEPLIEAATNSKISLKSFDAITGNVQNYLILLTIGIIFGGIVEELVFRGFVIGWGTQLFGDKSGLLLAFLSAAAFGAAHLYQGIAGVLSTGLTGLIFGILYLLTGRKLLPVVLAHMTVNFIGITQIYLGYHELRQMAESACRAGLSTVQTLEINFSRQTI